MTMEIKVLAWSRHNNVYFVSMS